MCSQGRRVAHAGPCRARQERSHRTRALSCARHCRDTWGPLSRPKHPVPAPNPVATQNFCRDTGPKISVATEKASVSTQTAQYPWEPCRDTGRPCHDIEPGSSIARASQQRAHACRASPGRVVHLASEPYRDTEGPVTTHGQGNPVATENPKWAVAFFGPSYTSSFFFFFSPFQNTINSM